MSRYNNENITNNIPKLKWACRRGMLELDVILGNFLEEAYSQLNQEDKLLFVNLLGCSDPELFDWLLGSYIPEDQGWAHITGIIRRHARSRI